MYVRRAEQEEPQDGALRPVERRCPFEQGRRAAAPARRLEGVLPCAFSSPRAARGARRSRAGSVPVRVSIHIDVYVLSIE